MSKEKYISYVDLMLKVLPYVAKEKYFSLKGGTAINLFVRNMPRLSVDIDLAYIGLESREEALRNAESALGRIKNEIEKNLNKTKVLAPTKSSLDNISKLLVVKDGIQIKIEVNPVIRGTAFESENRDLVENAEKQFKLAFDVPVVSIPDLYGGKIVAALDRQHPRDIFDIKLLMENEGLTTDILEGFLVYLSSHNRPLHEVVNPPQKNMKNAFKGEFEGMTNIEFSYDDFENTRSELIKNIQSNLSNDQRKYLLSLQEGSPNWRLLGVSDVENLPAVKWKLKNIQKMEPEKRDQDLQALSKILKL
jgi:predicted nucleotidyltransferase component of viral defense system